MVCSVDAELLASAREPAGRRGGFALIMDALGVRLQHARVGRLLDEEFGRSGRVVAIGGVVDVGAAPPLDDRPWCWARLARNARAVAVGDAEPTSVAVLSVIPLCSEGVETLAEGPCAIVTIP